MVTKISKWGNSMAIRLPNKFIKDNKLTENSELEMILDDSQITLRSIKKKPKKMSIKALTKGMSREDVLKDFEEWPSVGKEKIE